MSSRAKRPLDDLGDDDPDDTTYGSRNPKKKPKKMPSSASRPRKKAKRRAGYGGSDDDVEDDDDDISDDDLSLPSGVESEVESGKQFGRGNRQSRTKVSYAESSGEDDPGGEEEDIEESGDDTRLGRRANPPKRTSDDIPSLVIKLKPGRDALERSTRSQTRRTSSNPPESSNPAVRRSRRLSHSDDEALVSIPPSGKGEQVERAASSTPDPERPTRFARAAKRPETSAIIEASQEDSGPKATGREDPEETHESPAPEIAVEEALEDENVEGEPGEMSGLEQGVIAESVHGDDDDDEEPVTRRGRTLRVGGKSVPETTTRSSQRTKGNDPDEGSDFAPEADEAEDEDMSASDESKSPQKESHRSEASSSRHRGDRRKRSSRHGGITSDNSDAEAEEAHELRQEVRELKAATRARARRRRQSLDLIGYEAPARRARADRLDYTIRPELWPVAEEDDQPIQAATGLRRGKAAGTYRSLWETRGPFGLAGGPPPMFGGTGGVAAGGADSDSSDDEMPPKTARGVGGTIGMTPTSTAAPSLFPQPLGADPAQGASGGPANLGKIKDRKALADADPLGVDQYVNFDGVGGLDGHINQLKEMVMLPLLYPEVFTRFHITPPRGVLFHGPPGTGKTLLARALASSVSSQGRKVTFYMRKGADALSKWVGEAEKQLRLLFEEARKNQPSIIFFDEIDGLAPVRSSKQDQIHASIVATLLALMDGMDGRGQVIVIGATNRPDTVDPALRRPGRFDREFYFPLPNENARRSIINIHTKNWDPPLASSFKDQLAKLTKGYGGADLRALCTEAALNAVQGTYPQIYQSNEKLVIDEKKIKVLAKDFMISVNKMIPSSERSAASNAAPLESNVEPLLRDALNSVSGFIDEILPETKQLSALEEAEYDDRDENAGFDREIMQQNFDHARVFRPRLLVYGMQGMGQQYVGQALLNKFERLHVQSLDLSVLYSDTTRSPEAAIVQLFNEARSHKPSVIYIPNVQLWYQTVERSVLRLFTGLLRSLRPNEPVLLLGIMELERETAKPDPNLLKDLFGFSQHSHIKLDRPREPQRREFFQKVISLIRSPPTDFPDLENRKKRLIPPLEKAFNPVTPKKPASQEELKAQKKSDRNTLNMLKIKLNPIMDQLKLGYKGFRRPPIEPVLFQYLYDEQNPDMMGTDLPENQRQAQAERPYELDKDVKGVPVIREVATGKLYYNLELVTIERRLSNGYYKRPKDFVADIKRINKDAKTHGDTERILKANQMLANVQVDTNLLFDTQEPALVVECENVYLRERERERQAEEKARRARSQGQNVPILKPNIAPYISTTTTETSGPVVLGQQISGQPPVPNPALASSRPTPVTPLSNGHSRLTNGYSDADEDIPMPTVDDDDGHREDRPDAEGPEDADTPLTQTQRSQRTALTTMAHNSQTADYYNSASTTSSGQKTSDKSRSSDLNTQTTNGMKGELPDYTGVQALPGGSQLADTQEMNYSNSNSQSHASPHASDPSQPSQAASSQHAAAQQQAQSAMPPPSHSPRQADASAASHPDASATASASAHLILVESTLQKLHDQIVHKSSGFSVEQLEQMNAALMDTVWRKRGEWNRNIVVHHCSQAFNKTVADIEEMQRILPNSQEDGEA